jgi:hypothetical protein
MSGIDSGIDSDTLAVAGKHEETSLWITQPSK